MTEEFIGRPERRINLVVASASARLRPYRTLALALATIAGLGAVFYLGRAVSGDLLFVPPAAEGLPLPAQPSVGVPPVIAVGIPSVVPSPDVTPVLDGGGPYLVFAVPDQPEGYQVLAANMSSGVADDPTTTKVIVKVATLQSQAQMVNKAQQWGGAAIDVETGLVDPSGRSSGDLVWFLSRGTPALRGPFTLDRVQEGVLSSDGGTLAAFTGNARDGSKVDLTLFRAGTTARVWGTYDTGGERGVEGQLHPVAWGDDGTIYAVHVCYCEGVTLPQEFLSFDPDGRMRRADWLGIPTGGDFSVSAGGRWIAYLGAKCTSCTTLLTIGDTKTHTIRQIHARSQTAYVTPIVSPSGKWVAYFDPSSRQMEVRSVASGAVADPIDIDSGDVQLLAWLDEQRFVAVARNILPGTADQTISILVVTPGEGHTETGASVSGIENIYHGPDVTFLGWIR